MGSQQSSHGLSTGPDRTQSPGTSRSLLIQNGLIVTAERRFEAAIRIRGDKIAEMGLQLPGLEGEQEIDARGLLVLPGGIDPHVHLTAPPSYPQPWVDDFTSGSRAALAGGITTLGNMCLPEPGETPLATLQRELEVIQQQAIADFFLHPVLNPPTEQTLGELPELLKVGHRTIKIFMSNQDFDAHAADFLRAVRQAGQLGILTLIHCEDAAILADALQLLVSEGRTDLRYYAESRPPVAEVAAVHRAAAMAEATGAPLYVAHLTTERALRICEQAQAGGLTVHVETRPLFLHLTSERYDHPDRALFIVSPPLREPQDVEALWDGLVRGTIQTVASDHAARSREQRLDPFLKVTNLCLGINGLQTTLPMLHSEGVLKSRISLEQFVAISATNPARIFGLYPQKGTIAVGTDADLVLWDPTEVREIRGEDLHSRAGFSIFEGWEITGWPKTVIRRGEIVYRGGHVTAQAGSGVFVQPTAGEP
jgi:dihydropyrimidinase